MAEPWVFRQRDELIIAGVPCRSLVGQVFFVYRAR
jgi:hypothetical protein